MIAIMAIQYSDSTFRYFDEQRQEQRALQGLAHAQEPKVEYFEGDIVKTYDFLAKAVISRDGERVLNIARLNNIDLSNSLAVRRVVSHTALVRDLERAKELRSRY
jgi:hypothetical protein